MTNIPKAAEDLGEADARLQGLARMAAATSKAVRALLLGPDDANMRMGVIALVDELFHRVSEASNDVNHMAEAHGVNVIDDRWRATHRAIVLAVDSKRGRVEP